MVEQNHLIHGNQETESRTKKHQKGSSLLPTVMASRPSASTEATSSKGHSAVTASVSLPNDDISASTIHSYLQESQSSNRESLAGIYSAD